MGVGFEYPSEQVNKKFGSTMLPSDTQLGLQHLRESLLGSRQGSRRKGRRCVSFDLVATGRPLTPGPPSVEIPKKREEALGCRHGTPRKCRKEAFPTLVVPVINPLAFARMGARDLRRAGSEAKATLPSLLSPRFLPVPSHSAARPSGRNAEEPPPHGGGTEPSMSPSGADGREKSATAAAAAASSSPQSPVSPASPSVESGPEQGVRQQRRWQSFGGSLKERSGLSSLLSPTAAPRTSRKVDKDKLGARMALDPQSSQYYSTPDT